MDKYTRGYRNINRHKSNQNKRRYFIGLFILVILIMTLYLYVHKSTKNTTVATKATTPKIIKSENPKATDHIRFIATGDTIAHDAINAAAKGSDGTYNYYQFMKSLQPYFDKADVRFCNQAVPGGGVSFGISGYPVFNSPLEIAHDLNKLGCNVVNTGTNHTFDRGQSVINAELNYWDTLPNMLAVAGANRSQKEQETVRYFDVKGVKFAFVSYTTYTNSSPATTYGLNMYNDTIAKQQILSAKSKADIVIVSMRWGTEYSPNINALQSQISQKLTDYGADVVLGHGPHVLQPVKQLQGVNGNKTLVWYSIGNFMNAQIPIESLVSGIAVMDINTSTKKLELPKFLPIYMHYEWTAQQKAQSDLLKRHAFTISPLDQSADLLTRSQNNTTVAEQTSRVQLRLNQFTPVTLLTSLTY